MNAPQRQAFLSAMSAEARAAFEAAAGWESHLSSAVDRARAVLGNAFDDAAFAAFLGERVRASDAPELKDLRIEDLAVAHGALARAAAALEMVEREVRRQVEREARKARAEAQLDETAQLVRELLLTPGPRRQPALTQYSGRGELGAFVRVIAVRELIRLKRRADERRGDDDDLQELLAPADDPELEFLRAHYRDGFRAAFAETVRALDARERTLLRQHFVEGATLDELAAAHAVHRATVARWLVKAREAVARGVRDRMASQAGLTHSDLDSLLKLVGSRLDISLRHLNTPE